MHVRNPSVGGYAARCRNVQFVILSVTNVHDARQPRTPRPPRSLDPAIPSHPSEFACIDLVNSAFTNHLGSGPPIDRLPLPGWQAWFLDRHGFALAGHPPAPLDELARLRRRLRGLLERWARRGSLGTRDARVLDGWVGAVTLRRRLDPTREPPALVLEPVSRDWSWVTAEVAVSAVGLIGRDAPSRLKACANPDCSWMFYDESRNGSRRFCSSSPCASVVRVRRFRRTRTNAAADAAAGR